MNNILIIGAGLCGSLLALRMAQRGYKVQLIEKRPDLRQVHQDAGRSINLAFSDRGMTGIKRVGLEDEVLKLCIPMHGRMIHNLNQEPFMSNYSGREGEYINSISRTDLNAMLLDACDKMENLETKYNLACKQVFLEEGKALFEEYTTKEQHTFSADVIFGADGAGSSLRKSMFLDKNFLFSFSQDYLTHGYKELSIPPAENNGYRTYKNALHIWPRGEDMLIALPNLDGSFTVTLFLPYSDSDYCFDNLTTPEMVTEYFTKEFPDVLELIPNLPEEFFQNPTGPLGTIKCSPWHTYGKTLVIGDAAHAIVPFYGQGMNASFEDVTVFDDILDTHEGESWDAIFKAYEKARKPDTDAIAQLAVDNFHEMKEHTASDLFQQKRKLEMAFEAEFPEGYHSKYSLVTFKEDIGYKEAKMRGRAQDKAILNLLDDGKLSEALSLKEKLDIVNKETEAILHDDAVLGKI